MRIPDNETRFLSKLRSSIDKNMLSNNILLPRFIVETKNISYFMKKIIKALKVALVYVGTMVGAGFATGQEIQLYFYNTDVFTIIVSSLTTGAFCILMLFSGQKRILNEKSKIVVDLIFAVSGIITTGIMLSGIKSITQSPFIVLISVSVCILVAVFGNKAMKIFNAVAVPLIIVSVLTTAFVNGGVVRGEFKPFNAISYSAMNVFFESVIMYGEGEKMNGKEILITGAIVSVVIFVLVYSMRSACAPLKSVMPYLASSRINGLSWLSYLVVILAIYSTIVNCIEVTIRFGRRYFEQSLVYAFIFLSSYIISVFSFDIMIEKIYPIFGYMGIAFDIYLLILLSIRIKKKRRTRLPLSKNIGRNPRSKEYGFRRIS